MSLGRKVKQARKELGLTQQEFAKKVGISRGYLSDIERERNRGNIELINKLSNASGKPLTYFLEDSSEIEVNSYDVLDSIINNFFETGLIDEFGNYNDEVGNILSRVVKKEIALKAERMRKKS